MITESPENIEVKRTVCPMIPGYINASYPPGMFPNLTAEPKPVPNIISHRSGVTTEVIIRERYLKNLLVSRSHRV
jgi:hypothetical protein